jgi:hypothetical protein
MVRPVYGWWGGASSLAVSNGWQRVGNGRRNVFLFLGFQTRFKAEEAIPQCL